MKQPDMKTASVIKKVGLVILSLVLCFCLFSCSKEIGAGYENKDIVLKANKEKISYDTYRYFYMNYKDSMPQADEEELYSLCTKAIAQDLAITLLAKEYKVELDDSEKETLNTYVQSIIDEKGGEEEYYQYLSENYLTGDLFRHLYSQKLLEQSLREYLMSEYNNIIPSDDASFEKDLEKNFMAAKQILIKKESANASELASEIMQMLEEGEDFDTLVAEYNEDEGTDSEYGRYFTKGMMVAEFEEAVLSVKEGELYPEVVESSVGYHIIKRLPIDMKYVDENYETLRYYYQTRCANEIISEKADSIKFEKTKKFDSFTAGK
ncbi:MAG: peptidylprolyl isomerase [Clostridia bacterium]|nr:peptidylprolyl isomerase [Clostridia bacterium]